MGDLLGYILLTSRTSVLEGGISTEPRRDYLDAVRSLIQSEHGLPTSSRAAVSITRTLPFSCKEPGWGNWRSDTQWNWAYKIFFVLTFQQRPSYRWNVYVPPKFICSMHLQCDDIWRWGLWEVISPWKQNPHELEKWPYKRDSRKLPSHFYYVRS